jgi:hypothetical protein
LVGVNADYKKTKQTYKNLLYYATNHKTIYLPPKSFQFNYNLKTERVAANSGLAYWRVVTCFVETFLLYLSYVLCMNFGAKNPPLRQAAKRWLI